MLKKNKGQMMKKKILRLTLHLAIHSIAFYLLYLAVEFLLIVWNDPHLGL